MSAGGCDVLVIGGGLAGLCAALAARERGAAVSLIESAPSSFRGGHARHARNFRAAHREPTPYSPDCYPPEEFLEEWLRVGGEGVNAALARALVEDSQALPERLIGWGVHLQDPATGLVPYSRRTAFLLGGGKAMIDALYRTAARRGIALRYETQAERAEACGGARAVVVASGGPMGGDADEIVIRGGPHSDGRLLQKLIEAGAESVGDANVNHRVAVDARGPKYDGGIVTRVTAIPYGVVVDRDGETVTLDKPVRGPAHYAAWGPRVAQCPGGIAYLILDAEGLAPSEPNALAPIEAPTLPALAAALGLARTPRLDLAAPPFFAIPLRAGLTFAHYGVAVDSKLRIKHRGGVWENLFAAGAIMAANLLPRGYLAGLGLTLAALTGAMAGEAAAAHARG